MATTRKKDVMNAAMALSPKDRESIADALYLSIVDESKAKELEALAERRWRSFKESGATARPVSEVIRELRRGTKS